jgi:AcrR family transcriptional regulator
MAADGKPRNGTPGRACSEHCQTLIVTAVSPQQRSSTTPEQTGSSRVPRQRTGRRPGRSTTRDAILSAARDSFAEHGYDRTSVRAVAVRAGVDAALVRRFFGSKEGLLVAALTVAMSPQQRLPDALHGDPDTLGERMIDYFLSVWDEAPHRDVLIGMIRSACTNQRGAAILRNFLASQILDQLAAGLDRAEAHLRAGAIGAQLVGLAMVRYVVQIEPLASAPPQQLRTVFGPTLQRYANRDIGPLPHG